MIKTTAFIGLGLCILVLSGCSPKIDGSSPKAYESSLVKVASGLDNEKRELFKVAADIVIARSPSLPNLDEMANARAAISGKSADDVINEATDLAKREYIEFQKASKEYDVTSAESKAKNDANRKLFDQVNIKINRIDRTTTSERYKLEYGTEEYDREYDYNNEGNNWRTRVTSEKYIASIVVSNDSDVDVDSLIVFVKGVAPNGKSVWQGFLQYESDLGAIKRHRTRSVTLSIETEVGAYDSTNWLEKKPKPTLKGVQVGYGVSRVVTGGKTLNWNDSDTADTSAPTLQEDIDHFLTLIKYKR